MIKIVNIPIIISNSSSATDKRISVFKHSVVIVKEAVAELGRTLLD